MLSFVYVRVINLLTGQSEDELFNHTIKNEVRPWSDFDDCRFPRAGCSLENCETLIIDDKTGAVYAVNTHELMKQGVHLPVMA